MERYLEEVGPYGYEADCEKVEGTTAPFQYALSTNVGCECVAHVLQSLIDLSREVTVTSIHNVDEMGVTQNIAQRDGRDKALVRFP